jgi:hypothetical protein
MSRHRILTLVALTSVVIFSQPGFPQPLKTVTMARTTGSIGMVPLEFAVNRGFFKNRDSMSSSLRFGKAM